MNQDVTLSTFEHSGESHRRAFFELFEDAFSNNRWVAYDPAWGNGTGYFDNAVDLVKLSPGETACSADPKGRRILFIGTRFGSVVVFQRLPNTSILAVNRPAKIARMFVLSNRIDEESGYLVFGSFNNIGKRIEAFFNEA